MEINTENLFTTEKAKKLLQDLPSNKFDSINYEETKITFMYKDNLTYIITSDTENSPSLIRKIVNKIANKSPSSQQDFQEFIDSGQFDKLIQRKIKSETPILPNRLLRNRFSSGRSVLLSIIGAVAFFYAIYYINLFTTTFLPFNFSLPLSNFWTSFLLLFLFSIFTGIFTGVLTGKTFEALFSAYFTFSLLFLIPFSYSVDLLEPLQFPVSDGYKHFLAGFTFPFSGALLGVGIGLYLHKDRLVPTQLPFKKKKELIDPVEKGKSFFEIIGKATKVMAQEAKSPDSKGNIQKVNENAYQAVNVSKQILQRLRKNKVKKTIGLEAEVNKKAKAVYQGSQAAVATAKVDDVKNVIEKINEFFPKIYPYYFSE